MAAPLNSNLLAPLRVKAKHRPREVLAACIGISEETLNRALAERPIASTTEALTRAYLDRHTDPLTDLVSLGLASRVPQRRRATIKARTFETLDPDDIADLGRVVDERGVWTVASEAGIPEHFVVAAMRGHRIPMTSAQGLRIYLDEQT